MKVYFQRHSISAPFLDIKGSTRLALKYDLETVQKIKMLFFQLELKLLDILVVISTDFKEMQFCFYWT